MIFVKKIIKSLVTFFIVVCLILISIYFYYISKPERIIFLTNKILDNNYSIQFQQAESYSKFFSPEISYKNIQITDVDQKEIFKADELKIGISIFRTLVNNYVYLNSLYLDNIKILDSQSSGNLDIEFKYKINNILINSDELIFSAKNAEIINKNGELSVFNKEGHIDNIPFSELSIFKDNKSKKYLFNTELRLDENIIENEELLDLTQFTNKVINLNLKTQGYYDPDTGKIKSFSKYIFKDSSLVTNTNLNIDRINSTLFTNIDEKIVGIFSAKIPNQSIEGSIKLVEEEITFQSNISVNMDEIINFGQYLNLEGKESFEIKLVIQDKVSLELVSDLSNTLVQSNISELNKSKNENLKTKIFISDISLPTYSIKNNKFKAFIDSKNNGYFSYGSFFDNELKQLNFADGFYIYLELNDLKIDNILIENDNQNTTNLKFVKLKIKELDFFDNKYTDQIFEINFLEDETYASFYGDNLNGNLRIDSSGFSRIDVYNTKFEFKGIDLIESNNSIKFDDINLRFVGKNIQTFNDIFQDIDFYLLRNKRVTTVDNIRISSENFNIGPTFDNEKAYISYDNLNDLYKIKGSYEINNQSDLFVNLINYDFKYLYSDLNIQWKSINQLKELEGKIKFKIKDLESNANLPDSALLRALRILNLNALVGNLSNDLAFEGSSLIVSRAEGDFIIGKNRALLSNPIKLETPEAKMNWKGEIIKNQNGLLDELDLDLEMRLKFSENIPWYAALFGGIPALAGGFVLENIIDERVDDASTFKFSVTGSIDDPKINRLN